MRIAIRPRREFNPVRPKRSRINVAILLPIPYRAAMSSLFLQFAYLYLNSLDGVSAIRLVYNYSDDCVEVLDEGLSIKDIDLLILSLPYELNYFYVVRALKALNIEVYAQKREKPIVVAGGVAPSANPLPLLEIVDAVAVGDAEPLLPALLGAVADHRSGKKRVLDSLSSIDGVVTRYTVESSEIKRKNYVEDLDRAPHPLVQVVPIEETPAYGRGFRLEVSRGCARMCPFCMESRVMNPFRYRSMATLMHILDRLEELRSIYRSRIIIYSLSLLDTPVARDLLRELVSRGYSGSIPSMRPEHLADQEILDLAKALGQRTLTIAPESPIPDIARTLGKSFNVETLAESCLHAYRRGFNHVKMYFIYGAAGESPEQFATHFAQFIKELADRGLEHRNFIEVGINPLIPKPWTCFESLPPIYALTLEQDLERLASMLEALGVKPSVYSARLAFIQSAIALGDDRVSKYLVRAALKPSPLREFMRELLSDRPTYIYRGWDDPPWRRVIDIGADTCRYVFLDNVLKRITDGTTTL